MDDMISQEEHIKTLNNIQNKHREEVAKIKEYYSNKDLSFMFNSEVNIYNLYNFIQNNLSFNKVIELYELLDNKIKTFNDKVYDYSKSNGEK